MRVARLATLSVASVLLPVQMLSINEEALNARAAETKMAAEVAQNMTIESSLHILRTAPDMPPNLLSLLQESLSPHRHSKHHKHQQSNLRHRHKRSERKHSEQVAFQQQSGLQRSSQTSFAVPAGYSAVASAVQQTSKQIEATLQKWELANAKCCMDRAALESALEQLDEELAIANGQSSKAQAEMLKAGKMITENENKIPDEKDNLKAIRQQCQSDKINIERDMEISRKDLKNMDEMKLDDCSGSAALLQCESPDGESFLMLSHHTLQNSSVSHWRNSGIQRLLKHFQSSGEPVDKRPALFMQMEDHINPHKCAMSANPECQQVRDRQLVMLSETLDSMDELSGKEKAGEDDCEKNAKSIEENINNAQVLLKTHQTALAEATADYNEAMETSRLKNDERKRHLASMSDQAKKCETEKGELLAQKNSLLKIRAEVMSMQGLKVFIQDCKVSDWTPGECSASCGGGFRKKTRNIMVYPVGDGAQCLATEATESCNIAKCPVNCEMEEWGGWSACSAKCGGGVFERVRGIKRRSAHGGKPCGETAETASCNPQSCDENCKLARWSPWSECTKACDGGSTFKIRRVRKASSGQGKCPRKFSRKRFRMKKCNSKPCLKEEDKDKGLKCKAKRDVVLLLDGSAALKTSGWEAMKQAAEDFVKAMGNDVNIATLLFSGPKSKENYYKCTGRKFKGQSLGPPDMEVDCLLKWAHHMTEDHEEAIKKIKALAWPRGASLMTEALAQAETELNNGRGDAQSVVVVMTPGKPLNTRKVTVSARRLRRKARLIWVGVTKFGKLRLSRNIARWASRPWQENVVFDDFKTGVKKSTINTIVSDMCPTMEVV